MQKVLIPIVGIFLIYYHGTMLEVKTNDIVERFNVVESPRLRKANSVAQNIFSS